MKKLNEALFRSYVAEGLTSAQIAGRLGLSRTAVTEYARKRGIEIQPVRRDWWIKTKGLTDEVLKERCKQLARDLGVERVVTVYKEGERGD